jgi:hypothetical protein
LVEDPENVMRQVCHVTGLDPSSYPFHHVEHMPVRGSSTLRSEAGVGIHWTPVDRPAGFDPRNRWSGWDDHTHRRFAAVAGSQQRRLGYDLVETPGSDHYRERALDLYDRITDLWWRQLRMRTGGIRRAALRADRRFRP